MLDMQDSPVEGRYAFAPHDEVRIGGISYRPHDRIDSTYIFAPTQKGGVPVSYSHAELTRLVQRGALEHECDAFLPAELRKQAQLKSETISGLTPKQHLRAKRREAVVLAFLHLERLRKVKRTDPAINAVLAEIKQTAGTFLSVPSDGDVRVLDGRDMVTPAKVSAKSVRRWVSAYQRLGLAGLYDQEEARGNRSRRLTTEEIALMMTEVRGYIDAQRPTKEIILVNVKRAFEKANVARAERGLPELQTPSRETVRRAIASLDPFQADVVRYGLDYARNKHMPVGAGLDLTRPLQRVEMDEWKIDLATLIAEAGVLHNLTEDDRARLGLDRAKGRWWLSVAIDCTTRCILAMRLSRAPSSSSAVQTLDMAMSDKGQWSDAVGALSAWNMAGKPEEIVTDCGKPFVSFDTRAAAHDLGVDFTHAPAGLPEMRGRIERLFRTMGSSLLPRLSGRTFSNMIEKGDQDPHARAALDVEDLCEALIRWVVDIYHRQPHEGLGGETPQRCWRRLVEIHGVRPAPSLAQRRLAFGTRMERVAGKAGIVVCGVRYHSDELARWRLHNQDRKVRVRWYHENIGAIAVELGGVWIEVPAVQARFDGVQAIHWLAAARSLRAAHKRDAALDEAIVFPAIDRIVELNGQAMKRMGLLTQDWSEQQLLEAEERLFIGFQYGESDAAAPPARPGDKIDSLGLELPTAGAQDAHKPATIWQKKSVPEVSDLEKSVRSPAPTGEKPARSSRSGARWKLETKR